MASTKQYGKFTILGYFQEEMNIKYIDKIVGALAEDGSQETFHSRYPVDAVSALNILYLFRLEIFNKRLLLCNP